MKRIWILVLSWLVLYGSVAWAIEACLQDNHYPDHVSSEHHSHFYVLGNHGDSPNPSVIHCMPLTRQLGPAARVSAPEIFRSSKGVALHANFLSGALSAMLENDLWLEALFKRLVTFSSPGELPRYLVLSIFRI